MQAAQPQMFAPSSVAQWAGAIATLFAVLIALFKDPFVTWLRRLNSPFGYWLGRPTACFRRSEQGLGRRHGRVIRTGFGFGFITPGSPEQNKFRYSSRSCIGLTFTANRN